MIPNTTKKAITVISIAFLVMAFNSYSQAAAPTSGLVGYWNLNAGSGTSASDSAGSNTGTLTNGATWTTGQVGNAVNMDGVNDYIALPNMDVSGSGITIAAWIRSSSFNTNIDQRFISKASDTTEDGHYWMLGQTDSGGSKLRFRLKTGSVTTTLIASSGNLPLNTWYHAAATYNGSTMRLYLNGAEIGSVSKTGTVATSASVPVSIGRSPEGSSYMHGAIDEVRIYNRGLSASEITDVYQDGGTPPSGDTTPPTVSISSPSAGATVSGSSVAITANASDNVALAGVQFRLDGSNLGSEDTSAPYSFTWNTTTTSNGSHTLTAVARDSSNNTTTSSGISVTVSNAVTPPPPTPPPGSRSCPAFPSFPDANCTGVLPGVARTNSGSITTTSNGQVIENLNVNGDITVNHSNVIIRNVRVTINNGPAINNINCPGGSTGCSFTIEDSELDGTGMTEGYSAIAFFNYTMRRVNIHGFGEGPGGGSNILIEDSYIHDFPVISTGAHTDGMQFEFGANNIVRHNTVIVCNANNAAIQIGNQVGNSNNLVEMNLMGGGGYTLGIGAGSGGNQQKNNRITTQCFPTGGYFGPTNSAAATCGDRWYDGPNAGQLLSGQSDCSGTPSTFTLTVSKSGTGSGTVTATGINCGSDCTETVSSGTSVTLSASPISGSTFAGWSGGGCSGSGSCTVSVSAHTTVTATFNVVANQVPVGTFDEIRLSDGVVRGWSYDPDASSTANNVRIYIDGTSSTGTLLSDTSTNVLRSDVNTSFGITGNHGVEYSIPAAYRNGVSHSINVYGVDTSNSAIATLLVGSPKNFTLGSTGGTRSCPAFPSFPDANCTGVLPGVARTNSGSITTSSHGQVIQNLNVNGDITVVHDNVTIRNVRIANTDVAIRSCNLTSNACVGVSNLLIEDVEFDGTGVTTGVSAFETWQANNIVRRVNCHHYSECAGGSSGLVEDSYFHDQFNCLNTACHADAMGQFEFGSNATFRHNTCLVSFEGASSCFQIGNQAGNNNNLAEYNLMGGPATICARMGGTNSRINNNRFTIFGNASNSCGFGPIALYGSATSCGNQWIDGPNAGVALDAPCAGGTPPPPPPPPGPPTPPPPPPPPLPPGCFTSNVGSWQNASFTSQSSTFTYAFDMIPSQNNMDGVLGLSSSSVSDYGTLSAAVRFNPSGFIDVINGVTTYTASTSVPYTSGLTYHFRMVVNPATDTYSVYVTPPSSAEIQIANNYAFRTNVSSLANRALISQSGTYNVCNITLTGGGTPTPIVGDINLDHIVNSIDYSILNSRWFTNDAAADLNDDGIVNAIDFSLLNANWFKTW
jgi:hypothetical protein